MDLAAIREMIARLTDLTTEELDALKTAIVDVFDGLTGNDTDTVAVMTELADALTGVKAEIKTREAAAAEAEQAAEELRARMADLVNDEGDEGDEITPPVVDEDEGAEGEGDEGAEGADADASADQVPVTASGSGQGAGRASRMARGGNAPTATPPAPSGRRRSINVVASLTASGATRERSGETLTDRWALAETIADTLRRMPRNGAPRGDVIVASARYDLPPERQLGSDATENERKIEAVTGPQALVATGGICLPVNVDYGVPTWATAERPLKGALPLFQADRGGITYVTPPTLASTASATTVWTEANDANPTSPTTKPVYTVACGTPQTVYVNAIPTRLQFGNMQGRFAPEQIAANTDLAIAQAARVAELELLTLIDASSTVISSAEWLGATRDILATLDLACAGYRYRGRIPRSQMLTAIFPDWAKDLFRADFARELAHGEVNGRDALAVSDAQLTELFAARGVNVIWTLDGRAVRTGQTVNWVAQTFASQVSGAINKWPVDAASPVHVNVVWNLFVEGTMQVLDGGQLDLGIVRDSTLDATNDYETFIEPFEGLAFRGTEALTISSLVAPTGASGATVAPFGTALTYTPGN